MENIKSLAVDCIRVYVMVAMPLLSFYSVLYWIGRLAKVRDERKEAE